MHVHITKYNYVFLNGCSNKPRNNWLTAVSYQLFVHSYLDVYSHQVKTPLSLLQYKWLLIES